MTTLLRAEHVLWAACFAALLFCLYPNHPMAADQESFTSMTIEAEQARFDREKNISLYSGHVRIIQGGRRISGDRLEIQHLPTGAPEKITMTGQQVHLVEQSSEGDMDASANQMEYDIKTGTIRLTGDVILSRGQDKLFGESISYDISSGRIDARGRKGEKIRLIIQTPEKSEKKGE